MFIYNAFNIKEGTSNDDIFSNLLQELRSARHLNRQLCLELHKAKMQVQLIQQQQNEQHQPGSVAGKNIVTYNDP